MLAWEEPEMCLLRLVLLCLLGLLRLVLLCLLSRRHLRSEEAFALLACQVIHSKEKSTPCNRET